MKRLVLCLFMGLLLSSCLGGQVSEEVLAISITPTIPSTPLVNSSTPTATPSKTPLKIWNRVLPPSDISQYYTDLEEITLENVNRIEEIARWGKGTVKGIALSPDKATIAVSTRTGIYFYDTETLSQTDWVDIGIESDTERRIWCTWWHDNIDFSPDGKFLAISDLNVIKIWDIEAKKIRHEIKPNNISPESNIVELQYSNDGKRIIVTHDHAVDYPCVTDGRFEIYDTQNLQKVVEIPIPYSDYKYPFFFGDDNEVFFITSHNTIIVNYINGEIISQEDEFFEDYPYPPITIDSEGNGLWSIYKVDSKQDCNFLMNSADSSSPKMEDYSEDGLMAVTLSDSRTGDLIVWDFDNCKMSENIQFFPEPSREIDFSPKGKFILTGSSGGYFYYVWDVSEGKALFPVLADDLVINSDENTLYSLQESPNSLTAYNAITGEQLYERATGGYSHRLFISQEENNRLLVGEHLIDLSDNGHLISILNMGSGDFFFSPDGKQIGRFGFQENILFWDAETGLPLDELYQYIPLNGSAYYNTFSPSWSYVALQGSGEVGIWSIKEKEFVSIIDVNGSVFLFSIDENLLFTREYFDQNSYVSIWSVETGQRLYKFQAPLNFMEQSSVSLSPDGRLLAFLANDGTIRIWGVRKE